MDNIVILLNGDAKTEQDPKACKNVSNHFKYAVAIARAIDRLIEEGELDLLRDDLNDLKFEI